jgi:chromosome segregation ATPase
MFKGVLSFLSPYMLWVYIGIAVFIFGAGWQVNGWRLNAKIEKQKVVLEERKNAINNLYDKIRTQNKAIGELEAKRKDAEKRAVAAQKKASAISQASDKKKKAIEAVSVRPDANCSDSLADIERLLNEARK